MKKLMIAAAIVCAAAFAQAASWAWTSNLKSLTTATGVPITDTSSADWSKVVLVNLGSLAAGETINDLFAKATAADIIERSASSGVSGTTTMSLASGSGKEGRVTGKATFSYSSGLIANGDYMALMAYDGETLSQLVYTSGDDKGKAVDAVKLVSGIGSDASSVSGQAIDLTGNFAVAPEPTSGLLLLLGMAGLALRRRRA